MSKFNHVILVVTSLASYIQMADIAFPLEGLESLEAEVRVLRYHQRELDTPTPPHLRCLDYDVDESLLATTVPDPIRIRGVGGTTM